jgi:putative DNA primase/helicase
MSAGAPLPPINFKALGDALLGSAPLLVESWLPGGKRQGAEYLVLSPWRAEKTPSLSVRLSGERAGHWADFGGERRGADLVSLYAELHGIDQGPAAVELARRHGLEAVAGLVKTGTAPAAPPQPLPPPPPPQATAVDTGPKEPWRTGLPVPEFAPKATFKHFHRVPEDITHVATYSADGCLLGYVVRFRTSDGGKDTLPYTWCVSERDGAARWHWRQWDEPRPLYYPGGQSPKAAQGSRMEPPTVVVVEGERKADVLQKLLHAGAPGVYLVVGWPGGSKAWKKALWDWLAGCTVLLWPDCDGKREPLTKEEAAQCADDAAKEMAQLTKPLLPAHKQVGMVAMLGIGALLRDQHQCQAQLLPIPQPGEVKDGWDAADAIEADGWDIKRVLEFFGQAQPLPSDSPDQPATPGGAAGGAGGASGGSGGGGQKPPPAGAGTGAGDADGDDDDPFHQHLAFLCQQQACKVHQLRVNRKMLIAALRKSSLLAGCVGFNELTEGPETRQPWPWRAAAGPLIDSDPLRLGDFLSSHYKLPGASKAALEEAIDTVADENRFHPLRDWLQGLQHDGKSRIDRWLVHVLGLDPATMRPGHLRYMELVGRFILLGLTARALTPGCKFDYTPVLEGKGGLGKSTLIKELVGAQYFSDTHFEIGSGKDPYEQLAGIWGYELSEMTALKRADSEQAKQFLSSTTDRFRGAYGRYVVAHPRHCVIFCSTNKRQYLYDLTGNRRYWPFDVPNRPNLEWLQQRREQLFAEAVALLKAGAATFPTREEEEEFFVPQQRKRLVETAVQARLYELLTREGHGASEGRTTQNLTMETAFVTLDGLVVALGADAAKSTAQLEGQIKGWLEAMDWTYGRESSGQRRRGYRRPKVWPPKVEPFEDEDDAAPPGVAQQTGGVPGVGTTPEEETDRAPY